MPPARGNYKMVITVDILTNSSCTDTIDPHTTLANSERLHPEKSTDIQLLYHPGVILDTWFA